MNKHIMIAAAIGLGSLALPFAVQASTLSSVEIISVKKDFSGESTFSDEDSAVDGDASVELRPFAFVPDFVPISATQRANGTSEVSAETSDLANTELNTAIASFTQEETNTFGMTRDYTLDYSLTGMTARLNHQSDTSLFGPDGGAPVFNNPFADNFETLIASNYTAASFQYVISVNGMDVFTARADALANEAGGTTENVSEFTASLIDESGSGSWLFSVDDISGTIDLGSFDAGATLTVVSTLTARSYATNIFDELRNSVSSRSTDPVNVSSTGFLTSAPADPMTPVPLPAAGWMLIAGLGGLAAAGRRKKS